MFCQFFFEPFFSLFSSLLCHLKAGKIQISLAAFTQLDVFGGFLCEKRGFVTVKVGYLFQLTIFRIACNSFLEFNIT